MNNRVRLIGAAVVTLSLSIGAAKTRVFSQDTTLVKADNPPIWGANVRLVRDLTLGEIEGPPEYMFNSIASLAVARNGDMFALDGAAVRQYDARGKYLKTWGRRGAGPGEIGGSGRIALHADQLLVTDSRNQRINIYPLAGGESRSWPLRSAWLLWVDTAGAVYVPNGDTGARQTAVRISPTGNRRDTIQIPWEFPPPSLVTAERFNAGRFKTAEATVPYAPDIVWIISRFGEFVGGNNQRYAIERIQPGRPVFRIVRTFQPPAITAEERAAFVTSAEAGLRKLDPKYRYDGPPVPTRKPAFRSLFVDYDARIWVLRSMPSVRLASAKGVSWREPIMYDVISRDGQFLGSVKFADSFSLAHASGDYVWGTERGELDVQYVVRYRIAR